jgi:hypothetical protein
MSVTPRLAALFIAAGLSVPAIAVPCLPSGADVPPGANTTDPRKPFFIDTRGLDTTVSPPVRDPGKAGYPAATHLADGVVPPVSGNGNFILGASHEAAPETVPRDSVPHGRIVSFTMASAQARVFNPGVVRDDPLNCPNGAVYAAPTAPGDPSDLKLATSHPGPWARSVDVYVPAQYVPGTPAPILVFGDGGADGFYNGRDLFTVLDALIAQKKLPPIVAIGIGSGGQDAQGSERGREYDAVSPLYAEWVEQEVLPRAEKAANIRITHDPDGRATMGVSSSGAAAFTMAWFHPDLFRRVLAYSPTFTNQQWPRDPNLPGGAWQYHDAWTGAGGGPGAARSLVKDTPAKPIRMWFEAGDQDLFYPAPNMPDGMHDWTLADERMAAALAAKGYAYQFVLSRGVGHVDRSTIAQTLPEALLWLWYGYRPTGR